MLKINCDICEEEIHEKSALLFSPPRGPIVLKFHICRECYKHLRQSMKERAKKK